MSLLKKGPKAAFEEFQIFLLEDLSSVRGHVLYFSVHSPCGCSSSLVPYFGDDLSDGFEEMARRWFEIYRTGAVVGFLPEISYV